MDQAAQETTAPNASGASANGAGLRILRWIAFLPIFAILVLMTANITLGFVSWLETKELLLQVALTPVGLLLLALTGVSAYLSCLLAPGRKTAAIILATAYITGMLLSYSKIEWPPLTAVVFGVESLVILGGLALASRK
jgi:hypothetical protein